MKIINNSKVYLANAKKKGLGRIRMTKIRESLVESMDWSASGDDSD